MNFRYMLLAVMLCASTVWAGSYRSELRFNDSIPDYSACYFGYNKFDFSFKLWKNSEYSIPISDSLIEQWNMLLKYCPSVNENVYSNGIKILQFHIENEPDTELSKAYTDTLMLLYDRYIQYFPNRAKTNESQKAWLLGQKGIDLITYNDDRFKEANDLFRQSIDLEQNKSEGTVLVYYLRSTIKMARSGLVDSLTIVEVYNSVMKIADNQILNYTINHDFRNLEIAERFKENILDTFESFADCTSLKGIFGKYLQETPPKMALLKMVVNNLEQFDCESDSMYRNALFSIYELEPSTANAFQIANYLYKSDQFSESLPYFEESIKSANIDTVQRAYKMMSEIYSYNKNYPKSRQMALKAIELKPTDGFPYITIGNLYAETATNCGTDDFTSNVAYWVAVDKFRKAIAVDSTLFDKANQLIITYSSRFPSKESIVNQGLKEGSNYTIECWFTENTIVRALKNINP